MLARTLTMIPVALLMASTAWGGEDGQSQAQQSQRTAPSQSSQSFQSSQSSGTEPSQASTQARSQQPSTQADASKQRQQGTQQDMARSNDRTDVVPDREQLTPLKPSVGVLDDNTQRAHDRNRGVEPKDDQVAAAGGRDAQADGGQEVPDGVRDWAAIDRNDDGLIGPDEMARALEETGPQAREQR